MRFGDAFFLGYFLTHAMRGIFTPVGGFLVLVGLSIWSITSAPKTPATPQAGYEAARIEWEDCEKKRTSSLLVSVVGNEQLNNCDAELAVKNYWAEQLEAADVSNTQ